MKGCEKGVSCRNLMKKLKMLPLTSKYLLSLLMFAVQKKPYLDNHGESQYGQWTKKYSLPAPSKLNHLSKSSLLNSDKNL
jgi:hypothetical protein